MTDDARTQRRLHEILETGIGAEGADLLMDRLPQTPIPNFATRDDLHATTIMLRGEMAELRGELRGEMSELRSELRGEMADLRTELRGEMSELRSDVRTDLATFKVELQRFFLATNVATMIALVALVLAVNSL